MLSHSPVELCFSTLLLYQESASVVAMPKSLLKELNTRIFNFFWAGKKARVARKVLHHSKSQGGFSVVSVELKIHSLLGQWFRRFGVSPGAWVSLLTFWCFDCFGVSPMSVLSQPSTYDIATLPTFFYHCFLAWIVLGGSLSGDELVVGSSLTSGPLLVSTMTYKSCYDLLLSGNPALPHCVGKFLPLFGAWEWSSTWCSLFFMPLDHQVIDLSPRGPVHCRAPCFLWLSATTLLLLWSSYGVLGSPFFLLSFGPKWACMGPDFTFPCLPNWSIFVFTLRPCWLFF